MACESLLGTWKSVKDKSIAYNLKYHSPTEAQLDFYKNTLGILTYTYTESEVKQHQFQTVKFIINDKVFETGFDERSYPYEVVSCSKVQVEKSFKGILGEDVVSVIQFEKKDLYYMSSGDPESYREYFERVEL